MKGAYIIGYIRPDVVAYRTGFTARLDELQSRRVRYHETGLSIPKELPPNGEALWTICTHGEPITSANDSEHQAWHSGSEPDLRRKSRSRGIMLSDYHSQMSVYMFRILLQTSKCRLKASVLIARLQLDT